MAVKSLAVKYRPTTFDDVSEQSAVKMILTQQLATETTKNAYLFCGGAGTGKTTCARIFAQEINKHCGNPIEMDAASNNSVDDVRDIINQAKTKSLDSEYKVFILDECHALSNTAWQAILKLIEEPPAKSVFIFCTTDPQKIPKTILSRVQRYDFQRISHAGIVSRLWHICDSEGYNDGEYAVEQDALDYIAKLADGGMRDAITLLDKCLSYDSHLTMDSVICALGVTDYPILIELTDAITNHDVPSVIEVVEKVHLDGKDLKQFVSTYMNFILDVCKYDITGTFKFVQMPISLKSVLDSKSDAFFVKCHDMLKEVIQLQSSIKWDTNPKAMIESMLMLEAMK